MDIGGSNGGSAALPTLKGCSREITLFLDNPKRDRTIIITEYLGNIEYILTVNHNHRK